MTTRPLAGISNFEVMIALQNLKLNKAKGGKTSKRTRKAMFELKREFRDEAEARGFTINGPPMPPRPPAWCK